MPDFIFLWGNSFLYIEKHFQLIKTIGICFLNTIFSQLNRGCAQGREGEGGSGRCRVGATQRLRLRRVRYKYQVGGPFKAVFFLNWNLDFFRVILFLTFNSNRDQWQWLLAMTNIWLKCFSSSRILCTFFTRHALWSTFQFCCRDDIDMSRIHRGKKNKIGDANKFLDDKSDIHGMRDRNRSTSFN